MLISLHVKNFAIIDETEVEFGEGLNILTGETGAGKSILIGSIGAALGAKVSKDIIGRGGEYALVELTFDVPEKEVLEKIKEMGFYPEDGMFIISRKITENGRNISKINGEAATVSEVKEIAMMLMSVHGQNEHQSLLSQSRQLELVDEFDEKRIAPAIKIVADDYRKYKEYLEQKSSLIMDTDKRLREMDYLRFAIDEIDGAALKEGEEDELKARFKLLSNARMITEAISEVKALTDDEGVASGLGHAIKRLSKVSELDDRLGGMLDQLYDIESLVSDFNRDVDDYIDTIEDSEEELEEIKNRIDLIEKLKSKYGRTIDDILEHRESLASELKKYEDYETYLSQLEENFKKAEKKLGEDSDKLSALRKKSAKSLGELIRNSMKDLNFGQSELEIVISDKDDYSANGTDAAQILVSLNPGEPMLPLAKVASGGELSRIMLAIKSVFAGVRDTATLIFDEIDAGISGRTAQMVAEKLAVIAGTHQVICITHLPQIAAMADTHFVIEKSADAASTTTSIRRIVGDEVTDELARLTGGSEITDSVRASANEMKKLADEKKSKLR